MLRKFVIDASYLLLSALVLCAVWLPFSPQPAYAYVDPSVMTYTIQALAGVAVALSALAGVMLRRVRRKVYKTFNIDENANKAVEGPIKRISPEAENAEHHFMIANGRAIELLEKSKEDAEIRGMRSLNWPKRLAFSLLICIFAFFIILIAPALEIYAANSDSLVFSVGKVWWISVSINAALAVVCAFALSALKGKTFLRALLLVFCLTFAAYIQAFFMNSGMLPADGGYIDWNEWDFVKRMICSGIIWLLILVIPQVLSGKHQYNWLKATSAVAVLIIIMQAFGIGSATLEASKKAIDEHDRPYVTQEGLYTVSPDSNVIVFILDTFDTSLLEEVLIEDPSALAEFTDFTYFKNSVGTMVPTANAIPYLLSANKPEPGQNINDYRNERYSKSTLLPTIKELGYSIGLYTDSAMFNYTNEQELALARDTINIRPMKNVPLSIWGTYFAMNQCALYREAFWAAKPLFWYYTADINNRMIDNAAGRDDNDELYELKDAKFFFGIEENGLSTTDTSSKGAFRFIHLFGPHFPFNIDENVQEVGINKSDQLKQARGTLKVVDAYLQKLKGLGLYDEATIFVIADHGIWDEREDPIEHPTSPIMLVKPSVANADEAQHQPIVVSDVPVSHEDFAPTLIAAMGGNPKLFGSGLTIWQIDNPDRIRTYDALTGNGEGSRRFEEYQITDDALNIDNWSKTENTWQEE